MGSLLALRVLVGLFLLLELGNVAALYFAPGTTVANAVGVLVGWERSQEDSELGPFVRYLVNWVAGTKLVFIALWLVILFTAPVVTQLWACGVMVPAIVTFYWRLFPLIRGLDRRGLVRPSGYAKTLAWTIAAMMVAFAGALVSALWSLPS